VAVLAIAAACFYAFELNRAIGDVGVLGAFGLFGTACKVLGWNRPMLLFGAYYGAIIETNISRALMLSNGDPAVFLRRPISATLLLLAIGILTLATTCSVWRGPSKISPKGT
jgi:TctA family transporter